MSVDERREEPGPAEFGPGGYLPERAAKRARKIILREQMGLGWPIAAVLAGVLVVAAGIAFLLRTGPPGEPFVAAGSIETVDAGGAAVVNAGERAVLVVRAGGGVRSFEAPGADAAFCAESGMLESAEGAVWNLNGRSLSEGAESLRPVPSVVYHGTIYVNADPRAAGAAAAPDPQGREPACS